MRFHFPLIVRSLAMLCQAALAGPVSEGEPMTPYTLQDQVETIRYVDGPTELAGILEPDTEEE